jgi:hypothetical protein
MGCTTTLEWRGGGGEREAGPASSFEASSAVERAVSIGDEAGEHGERRGEEARPRRWPNPRPVGPHLRHVAALLVL